MKLLYSWFHIAIFDIFGDISGAGLSQGPAFGALYRALGAPDKKMIETRNRVRVWGKLFYFRSYVENVDSFWVLLSTKIDWNTESRKVGKSETRKVGKSETRKVWNVVRFEKIFFPRFSWTKWSPNPKKKQKWKFWKVRTFPPPGSAQQGPRADALGKRKKRKAYSKAIQVFLSNLTDNFCFLRDYYWTSVSSYLWVIYQHFFWTGLPQYVKILLSGVPNPENLVWSGLSPILGSPHLPVF